jgi:2-polyprenyl-6-methoxyphenol hydroxylase-like FAD-dependent oxidoreductase
VAVTADAEPVDGRHGYVFPTHGDLTCIYASWRAREFSAIRCGVERHLMRSLELVPDLAERVTAGERVTQYLGTNALPNFYRRPYGPGWALVGDAGHHKDPITATGMSDAFRDAELLAGAVHDGLSGDTPIRDALGGYELERNRRSRHIYQWTLHAAALADPTPMAPFLKAIAGDPVERKRFMSVVAGTVPFGEVLGAENQRRMLGQRASSARPGSRRP